jgi:NACalpha-BTF3-like transcription factor
VSLQQPLGGGGVSEKEIKVMMDKAGITREQAIGFLKKKKGIR